MKVSSKTEVKFSLDELDLKDVLLKGLESFYPSIDFEKNKEVIIKPSYETQTVPGVDPHDADYIQVFTGIEITVIA